MRWGERIRIAFATLVADVIPYEASRLGFV
jgi:hypothetical protein